MQNELTLQELTAAFKAEIHDRADDIDPNSDEDWHSMILGWAIAKGLSPVWDDDLVDDGNDHRHTNAHMFANYIIYDTNLG